MTIPKQIQKQAEEVERIEAELAAQNAPPEEPKEPEAPEAGPEKAEEAPAAEPETPPVPEPEAVDTPTKPVEDNQWEHRFKTLKGKYDAEVPRMANELRELRAQLKEVLAKAEKAPPPEPKKPLVDERDVENFGSDMIDLIDRKAREVAATMVEELRSENRELRERLEGVSEGQVASSRAAYLAELGRQVPDWEEINVDENFLQWLGELDPITGARRQDYLNQAYNELDLTRTAAIFEGFKKLKEAAANREQAPPAPRASEKLNKHVAPSDRKATPSTSTAPPKVWTAREIEQFYVDASKGKYRDNPQEAERIESEIDLAVSEGRVTA